MYVWQVLPRLLLVVEPTYQNLLGEGRAIEKTHLATQCDAAHGTSRVRAHVLALRLPICIHIPVSHKGGMLMTNQTGTNNIYTTFMHVLPSPA